MIDARYLVDHASDAAFAIDGEYRIVAWNDQGRRLLGYTRREVVGRHCSDVLQAVLPDGEPLCVPNCEAARCFGRFRPFGARSCLARHKDCHWTPVDIASVVMSRPARNGDQPTGVTVIFLRSDKDRAEPPLAGTRLRIFTFGRFGLSAGNRGLKVEKWERRQAVILLKLLVANLGRAVPRACLIDALWPEADEEAGWKRLKVTACSLRRELRAAGIDEEVVETIGKAYVVRREAVWLDIQAYEACIAKGAECRDRQDWDGALDHFRAAHRLYRGPYMNEDIHADWCAEERERLREIHLEMLADLAECHAQLGQYAEAVGVCRTILVDDSCREGIHRALMVYLVCLGHTDSARAQYHHCRRVLAAELAVEPMPETQELYRQVMADEPLGSATKPD
ncbi:MAG: PAS domain-containing protein [Hyphomicrobiales bacterium]|nr:PAS domain-containing protein [Hyphomicrobiales bacterium]